MNDYGALALGILCAGLGGELFIRGTVGLAAWARIPPAVIGATVAGFATSSPELSVSVNAALVGDPQIALGDALGSNVVNLALILGIALVLAGIRTPTASLKRDFPVVFAGPVLTALLLADGTLSRLDGVILLALFLTWLTRTVVEAYRFRATTPQSSVKGHPWRVLAQGLVGFALLVLAGGWIVEGAKGIALSFGLNEFVVGGTIVALGTSVPEFATTIIARVRGHDEVALGTILGNNIFNGLFIVSVAAIIRPIVVPWSEVAVALVLGGVAAALVIPNRQGSLGRTRGLLLLAVSLIYVAFLVLTGHQPRLA